MRGRAMSSTVLAVLIFGIALGIASYILASKVAVSSLSDLLISQVADTKAQILESGSTTKKLPELEAVEASKPVYIQIQNASGRVLVQTPGIAANLNICTTQSPIDGTASETTLDFGRGAQQFLTAATAVSIDGKPAKICAVTSTSTVHILQRNFIIFFLIGLPLALAGVAFSVRAALNRALGSVEYLRMQAEGMSGTNSGLLEVQQTRDEVERLGNTLNDLLQRLHNQSHATRQFIADAGHELRNPLATLRILLEFDEDSEQTLALAELERLDELVQNLLVLAKVDAHEISQTERIDLAQVLRSAIHTHQLRNPALEIRHQEDQVEVIGDARQIRSVIDNLLSNACRHAHHFIDVTLSAVDDHCLLAVHDDGQGLNLEDCERVFERFVRLDEARDRDEGGSGLGLAIASAIVTTMHGTITARPSPGGHFLVSLPLVQT
jgi:signal transduction histidine kinase